MNIIESIEVSSGATKKGGMCVIFYHSYSQTAYENYEPGKPTERKKKQHCEMVCMDEIKRITLNMSSVTFIYTIGYIKFAIPETFDLKPLADLADLKFGKGLKVMEHFAKFRNMKSDK